METSFQKHTHTHKKKKKTAKGTSYKIMESLTKFKGVKLQAARKEYGFRNVWTSEFVQGIYRNHQFLK